MRPTLPTNFAKLAFTQTPTQGCQTRRAFRFAINSSNLIEKWVKRQSGKPKIDWHVACHNLHQPFVAAWTGDPKLQ
jgi:hypothetical protein